MQGSQSATGCFFQSCAKKKKKIRCQESDQMHNKHNQTLALNEENEKSFADDLVPSDEHSVELQSVGNLRSITGFAPAT